MAKQNGLIWRLAGASAALSLAVLAAGQGIRLRHGTLIVPEDLPREFSASLKRMGGRLMSPEQAVTSVTGTLTDTSGTRQVQITVQAPGYLRFQANSQVITYDGSRWQRKNDAGEQESKRIEESLLANFPDALFLQLANGGGLRRIGGGFRADNGKTPNYAGPYWTLYAFSPLAVPGLPPGQALQQNQFLALDEKTGLLSEARHVLRSGSITQVTQTKFNQWFQQAGQWYPGEIVRRENGQQVLRFAVQQAATGSPLTTQAFQP
jgi:hypothetical protein